MKKRLLIIITIAVIAFLILGIRYLIVEIEKLNQQQLANRNGLANRVVNQNQPADENVDSGVIIPPAKTDCADEMDTKCWNTYRNEEYGFEVKFPGSWRKDAFYAGIFFNNIFYQDDEQKDSAYIALIVDKEQNLQQLSSEAWVNQREWPDNPEFDQEYIGSNKILVLNNKTQGIYFTNDIYVFHIFLENRLNDSLYRDIYQIFLQSFRYI